MWPRLIYVHTNIARVLAVKGWARYKCLSSDASPSGSKFGLRYCSSWARDDSSPVSNVGGEAERAENDALGLSDRAKVPRQWLMVRRRGVGSDAYVGVSSDSPVRRLCGSILGFGPLRRRSNGNLRYFHFVSNNLHFVSRSEMRLLRTSKST